MILLPRKYQSLKNKKVVVFIARYTIYLDEDLEKKLETYMKENKIKMKSVAIKDCIFKTIFNQDYDNSLTQLSQKLNRILYRQNINKKLIEQIFCNMGFPLNEKIEDDNLLKEFYENNTQKFTGRYD